MDRAFFKKIKQVLFNPYVFFKNIKKEKGISTAFSYFALMSLVYTLLSTTVGLVYLNYFFNSSQLSFILSQNTDYTTNNILFYSFIMYGAGLLLSFVIAGILHLWILLFGGKETYTKTYQLYVYSRTPGFVFGWLPFIGSIFRLYNLFLLILGTEKVHKISRTKAVLMYLIPIAVLGLVFLILMIFALYALSSTGIDPSLIQTIIAQQQIQQ